MAALFAHGRNVRANPTAGFGPCRRAETAGNLLRDFHQAQVAFGLVVIERHAEVGHKAQRFRLPLVQAQPQRARFTLFRAAVLSGHGHRRRIVRQAVGQHGLRACLKGFVRGRVQAFRARRLRPFDRAFDRPQQVFQGLPKTVLSAMARKSRKANRVESFLLTFYLLG